MPNDAKLHIDMPFDEALERFVQTVPAEMHANIEKEKGLKSPATLARESGDPKIAELSRRRKPKNLRKLLTGK